MEEGIIFHSIQKTHTTFLYTAIYVLQKCLAYDWAIISTTLEQQDNL